MHPAGTSLVDLYPALAHCSPGIDTPGADIHPVQVPAGTELFSENAPCRGFPLVLEGEVKVSRHSGDGRSLEIAIVAGSGTDALAGIAGRMTIRIEGGRHEYELDYTLPA